MVSYQTRRSSRRARATLDGSPWAPRGGANRGPYPPHASLPNRPFYAPTGPAADRHRLQHQPYRSMYPDRDPQPAASTSRPVSRNPRNLEDSLPNSSHGPSRAADPPAVVPAAAIPRPATQNAGARRTDSGWNGMKRSRWESTRGGHAAAPRRESTKEAKGRQVDNAARGNQDNRHTQFERELPAHLNKGSTPAAPPPATPADLFTVYVTNAPADMTEDELRVVFNDCGTMSVWSPFVHCITADHPSIAVLASRSLRTVQRARSPTSRFRLRKERNSVSRGTELR